MQEAENYMEVMSLRAWSSSSLMALYFSFWAYNSSIGGRVGWREGGVVRKGAWGVKGDMTKRWRGEEPQRIDSKEVTEELKTKRKKKRGKHSYTRK